ncbi:glycoside hydrolase family 6 protein [Streptomyces sp. SP18CS02]|uniref:glycoside hydrolase family 6 protein n=1 Tax=Streptomyces sp. SP18CS02 TaxID=3002531 RepID=UPI002E79454F|nr:glycoside hydrolase family 6 protein [Streptomyces sp. SP18CS02]MEE1753115.1 glycoside hydrolase family 6 protein [Streptomyces sp. SP18CS02]
MRRRIAAQLLAFSMALAVALAAGPAPAAAGAPSDTSGSPGSRLYTPEANPGAYRQVVGLLRDGRYADASGVLAMVRTPQAVWFGDQTPAEVERRARAVVRDAARERAVPVIALYNVPGRDCSNYSGGGASTTAEYRAWVDAVARGIGRHDAMVVLEPDSLALLPADCGQDDEQGTKTSARYTEVNHAVVALERLARTKVYLDTGHPGWHSVNSIVPRLIRGGVGEATGFFTNASNYRTEEDSHWYGTLISSCIGHVEDGGAVADCPDQFWPRADAEAWIADNVTTPVSRMKHFVTDTSRNGLGPWSAPAGKYTDAQEWCNPPGRGLGDRPTTATGDPLYDARLWIKIPGESDGLCLRGTAGPQDPERGMVDPAAGAWFPEQALELVRLAQSPLPRR